MAFADQSRQPFLPNLRQNSKNNQKASWQLPGEQVQGKAAGIRGPPVWQACQAVNTVTNCRDGKANSDEIQNAGLLTGPEGLYYCNDEVDGWGTFGEGRMGKEEVELEGRFPVPKKTHHEN